jgi:hypothetical protein
MATKAVTTTYAPGGAANGVDIFWSGLTFSGLDDGAPFQGADFADRTVQFDGTFGAGGSITLQGSNDAVTWFALTDPQGNAITKTAAGLEVIEEGPRYVRPLVTAGDGTTSLNCRIWARRNR